MCAIISVVVASVGLIDEDDTVHETEYVVRMAIQHEDSGSINCSGR